MAKNEKTSGIENLSFEDAIKQLTEIVDRIDKAVPEQNRPYAVHCRSGKVRILLPPRPRQQPCLHDWRNGGTERCWQQSYQIRYNSRPCTLARSGSTGW